MRLYADDVSDGNRCRERVAVNRVRDVEKGLGVTEIGGFVEVSAFGAADFFHHFDEVGGGHGVESNIVP